MRIPWTLLCALLIRVTGLAQPGQAAEVWTREQYTSEDGLLQNRVHAMDRDPWGGLLIGTEGGLVRFDGQNFRQIGIPSPEGLRPSRVLEIIAVPGGAFVVRDAGSRQFIYRDNALVSVTDSAPARRHTSRFAGGQVSAEVAVKAMDPDSVLTGKEEWPYGVRMVPLPDGKWCLRLEKELLVYEGAELAGRFPIPVGRWSHLFRIGDQLYVFDAKGQAHRVDVDRQRTVQVRMAGFPEPDLRTGQLGWRLSWEPPDGLASMIAGDVFYSIQESSDGTALTATRVPIELPTDCKIGAVTWLEPGRVLAMGTDTKGLFIFRKNGMRTLLCDVSAEGVNNAYMAQAPFGRNQIITSTRGVAKLFSAGGCEETRPPMPAFDETAIALDGEQRYWYGRHDTLFIFDQVTGEERVVKVDLRPLCFLEQDNGMWIGTAKGIFQYSDGRLQLKHPLNERDLSARPNSLLMAPDGQLWMATCSGVYRAHPNGGWETVEGLAGVCARSIALMNGRIFIGTYGSGAFAYKDGVLLPLPQDVQGFLSHVHAFMEDNAGFMWMSTNQGLFRVSLQDIEAWAKDTTESIFQAYYGKRAGIRNAEFNGGCSPPYARTGDGWASFPTMDGLVWFKPEEIADAYPAAPLLLEAVTANGVVQQSPGQVAVPWEDREVAVRFSLAYWGDPDNVKLEYSLENGDRANWSVLPPGQRELRFSSFQHGETVLRIRKVGASLRGESTDVVVRFFVETPYYRTAWFIVLCVLGGLLLFAAVLRFNAARLRRKNLHLERKVRARTMELMEANTVLRRSLEMKEMLVSIISHDIVTPLRFIARVSNGVAQGVETQDPQRVNDTLYDIARSSDKLHANAQGLLQWIKRQDGRIGLRNRNVAIHALVEEVLDMERERAREKGVQLVNGTPLDDVLFADRNVLSIVLHNLVANALTHTAHGHVTVGGRGDKEHYHLQVTDTGSGMPEAALRHALRVQGKGALGAMNDEGERDVQGLGLLIVADLLQLLKGSFSVESEAGKGTKVSVSIPRNIAEAQAEATSPEAGPSPHEV